MVAAWSSMNQMPSDGGYVDIAMALTTACARKADGTVKCFGDNLYGQASVPAGSYRRVVVSHYFSAGIRSDGSFTAWGLVNGTRLTPAPAGSFEELSAGGGYLCGLRADASVACWGGEHARLP
ncbi:MAG TPA: RCC1 domain-containing protein [Labilithrix sp.]|jgi:hypothetical protein|nr:RCC1 domain-containing protein [Labilithrix sp.]